MKQKLVIATSVILGLLVINFLLLTPVGFFEPKREGPVRVYFADIISSGHQAAIDLFNDRHRGSIEIVPVNLPFEKFTTNERKELLTRSLRSRSTRIDIFAVDHVWVPRFAKWAEPCSGSDVKRGVQETCRAEAIEGRLDRYVAELATKYHTKLFYSNLARTSANPIQMYTRRYMGFGVS